MADIVVEWQGLTLGGGSNPYTIQTLAGWDDLPEVTSFDTPRSRGHGDHVGDQFARSRIVTVEGTLAEPTSRNALAKALSAATAVSSDLADLTVTTFGETLTAPARLLRRSITVQVGYGTGVIPFALQWKCPDPMRYAPLSRSVATGLPTQGGGLEYPISYPLTFGTAGDPGQITLANEGTAPAPIVFEVSGGLPLGFELSTHTGERLVYPVAVPGGQVLTLDTGAGTVLAEGTSDRRGNLTRADWFQVPPGSSLTVQFTSLGGDYDPGANLLARYRPAYW